MDANVYRCLHCDAHPLEHQPEALTCGKCGASYPILLGVPLLLKEVRIVRKDSPLSPELVGPICEQMRLPYGSATALTLQEIFSYEYELPELHLAAENNYFFNRIAGPAPLLRAPPASDALPVNERIHYQIVDHLIPDTLPRGRVLTRNVRLRNRGSSVISSRGTSPVRLTYRWRTLTGDILADRGESTLLPIDLPPGRTISLPTLIRTPRRTASYLLELCLVQGNDTWLNEDAQTVGVEVIHPGDVPTTPPHWVHLEKPQDTYNYQEDHNLARDLVFEEMARRLKPGYRLLEVGGCCNPMTRGADAEIYSIDIDVQTLQVGQLSITDPAERLRFVAADVNDPPFPDQVFDCIALFSALHHFPRPLDVLVRLKRLLKKDGFLAIMCEPVGAYYNGQVSADFVRDLEQGINEQIFTAEEYHHMFQRAGLFASRVVTDRGSFKGILEVQVPTARNLAPEPELAPLKVLPRIRRRLGRLYSRGRDLAPAAPRRLRAYVKELFMFQRLFRMAKRWGQAAGRVLGQFQNLNGFQASLEVLKAPEKVVVGATAPWKVKVRNTGIRSWPSRGLHKVCLGYHWRRPGDREHWVHDDGRRIGLPGSLEPGQEAVLTCPVNVPLMAGPFVLEFDLVRNHVGWFAEAGSTTVESACQVDGRRPEEGSSDFDYHTLYAKADLEKDYWTVVGPGTKEEFESLGRAKLQQLVRLGLHADSRVLDVGCGTGQLTEALVAFLSPAGLYHGTDLAKEAIDFCRKRFRRPNFFFHQNEMTQLPLAGLLFDFIYLGSVFTHMYPDEIHSLLGELKRLLAPGGRIVADAFLSPSVEHHVGSRSMVEINDCLLSDLFASVGLNCAVLSSMQWNPRTSRSIFQLTHPEAGHDQSDDTGRHKNMGTDQAA
jgi:ubiquinone/menaquinone biosynthesis C-methylase UbiE